jgi:hypothetical protein
MINYNKEEVKEEYFANYETQLFISEICEIFPDMKLLGKVRVREAYTDYFSIKVFNETMDKNDETVGYSLTYKGLVNAIVWTKYSKNKSKCLKSNKLVYYFHLPQTNIKEVGDRHTIKSNNMRTLIRKIKNNTIKPDKTMNYFYGSNYSNIIKSIHENITKDDGLGDGFNRIHVGGKTFHTLLKNWKDGKDITHQYTQMLEKFEELVKREDELLKTTQAIFSKPLTIIAHNDHMDDNSCFVVTGKLKYVDDWQKTVKTDHELNEKYFKSPTDYNTYIRYDVSSGNESLIFHDIQFKFYNKISEYLDIADNISGRLAMYTMTNQNNHPDSKYLMNGLAKKVGRYDSINSARAYDEDLKICYLPTGDCKDIRTICVLES